MDEIENRLKAALFDLIGKECWGFVAGAGTGSVISLEIGNKILRKEPVNNSHLSDDVRNFDAECVLFIECVWRLDSDKEVICGAWDDNSAGERMLQGLDKLVGTRIKEVDVSEPSYDLTLLFSNDLRLNIFCDQVNEEDMKDNYMIFNSSDIFTVGTKSALKTEVRENEN